MQFYVTSLHSYIMLTHSLALSLKDLMRSAVDIPLNNNYDYNDFIIMQRIIWGLFLQNSDYSCVS